MNNYKTKFIGIVENSFRTNIFTLNPYREIGLVDLIVEIDNIQQRVAMPFYRSSGTNGCKQEGHWYPILGIKETDGIFDEFNSTINELLNKTVKNAKEDEMPNELRSLAGYSYTSYGNFLKKVANYLEVEFDLDKSIKCYQMDRKSYNDIIYSSKKYIKKNTMSQSKVFTCIIRDIVNELVYQ